MHSSFLSFLDLVVDPCGLDLLVDTATTLPDPRVDLCLASALPTNSNQLAVMVI